MSLDFSDMRFSDLTQGTESFKCDPKKPNNAVVNVNLEGTLFRFPFGKKKIMKVRVSCDNLTVKVEIDRDSLMEKYQFIETYGPKMWLNEKDDGWFPSTVDFFINNMKP